MSAIVQLGGFPRVGALSPLLWTLLINDVAQKAEDYMYSNFPGDEKAWPLKVVALADDISVTIAYPDVKIQTKMAWKLKKRRHG